MNRGARVAAWIAGAALLAALAILFLPGSARESRETAGTAPLPAAPASPVAKPAAKGEPDDDGPDTGVDDGEPDDSSRVSGTVFDASGKPAPAVLVRVIRPTPPEVAARGIGEFAWDFVTDELGRWTQDMPPGEWKLRARGEGTGSATATFIVPSDGTAIEAPTLHLPEGGRIQGRVVDREGKPLAAVRIRAHAEEGAWGETMVGGRRFLWGGDDVTTDADGVFTLRGLDDVPYHVAPDLTLVPTLHSEPEENSGVRPGEKSLLFRVLGAARLRGTVVDGATGDPVRTFTVAGTLFDRADGGFDLEVGDTTEVEFASPGFRTRKAAAPESADEVLRVSLEPADESGVLVLLVSGSGGEPIAGLRAQGVTNEFKTWLCTWSEPAREFRVGRTAAGGQTVFLQAEGWTPATVAVTVPAGGQARPEVKLQRCGSARVRVLDAAGNVLQRGPESVVLLDAEGKGPAVRWVYTRPQGTAFVITEFQLTGGPEGTTLVLSEFDGRLTGLLPGSYRLRVDRAGTLKEAVFAVAAGETVEVTIRL